LAPTPALPRRKPTKRRTTFRARRPMAKRRSFFIDEPV